MSVCFQIASKVVNLVKYNDATRKNLAEELDVIKIGPNITGSFYIRFESKVPQLYDERLDEIRRRFEPGGYKFDPLKTPEGVYLSIKIDVPVGTRKETKSMWVERRKPGILPTFLRKKEIVYENVDVELPYYSTVFVTPFNDNGIISVDETYVNHPKVAPLLSVLEERLFGVHTELHARLLKASQTHMKKI